MQEDKLRLHDIEALNLENSSSGQQHRHAPRRIQRLSSQHVWRVAWSNCTWMQALWRDLLCVGFGKQLWKVYRHDVPKVCPSSSASQHCKVRGGILAMVRLQMMYNC